MKSFKEQTDELIKGCDLYNPLAEKSILNYCGYRKYLCDRCKSSIKTLIKAGEYFVETVRHTDAIISEKLYFSKISSDMNNKIYEPIKKLNNKSKEIQESITKLKETIK